MTNLYHTPIVTGEAANAAKINAPLAQLDAAIVTAVAQAQLAQNSVINAGTAATLANGTASAGQKIVVVDNSAVFVPGAIVEYALASGVMESNTVATVDSGTQVTFTNNIGTGGIADNALLAVVPVTYANLKAGIFNARDYGASPSASAAVNRTAIQATITAACGSAAGGVVRLPDVGTYSCSGQLRGTRDNVIIEGSGKGTVLAFTSDLGANAGIYFENDSSVSADIEQVGLRDLYITLAHNDSIGVQFDRAIEPVMYNVKIQGNNDHTNGAQTGIIMDGKGDQSGLEWGGGLRLTNCGIYSVKYGVVMRDNATSGHFVASWIVGCSTKQAGSVGISIDTTSGQGTDIIGCEIEGWATGIADYGTYTRVIGNRFETVDTPIAQHVSNTVGWSYIGNTYTADCGALDIKLPYYGIRMDALADVTIGKYAAAGDLTFNLRTIEAGYAAKLALWHNAGSPLATFSVQSADSTNLFGETASGFEANLGSPGTVPLKVGTAGNAALTFYRNSEAMGGWDTSNNFRATHPSTSAWDTGHLIMGPYHVWIDSSGRLRIKNGAPASDGDGTIVGAQS